MNLVAIDFETFYDKKAGYSVSSMPYEAYCRDPRFDAYLVSIYGGPDNPVNFIGAPKDFNWQLLEGKTICAHNAEFDWQVAHELVRRRVIPAGIKTGAWVCTADLAVYFHSSRALAKASEALLGKPMSKSMRDKMSGVSWQQAVEKGWAKAMLEYGNLDAIRCWELATMYLPQWPEPERKLSAMTRMHCRHGVRVEPDQLKRAYDLLCRAKFEAENDIPWEWDADKTPLNAKELAVYCRSVGIPCPASLAEDSPECEAWEAEYGDKYPVVDALRRWRKANTHHHRIKGMLDSVRTDNTIPTYIKYGAAHTLRWGGDRRVNFQNQPRDPLQIQLHDGLHEIDIRGLLKPHVGCKFLVPDLSQIEPRCLNWMVGNTKFLTECRQFSPYTAYARVFFGWTGGDELKVQNKPLYKMCKAIVLGCGYGCGGKKFQFTAKVLADYIVDEPTAIQNVKDFRAMNPLITGLWRQLDRDMRRSAVNMEPVYEIELPSGRSMKYFNPVMLGDLTAQDEINGNRKKFYGGKLTENITQAVARDIFGHGGLLALDGAGLWVPFHVHDEAIIEVPENITKDEVMDVAKLFTTAPEWAAGVPIASEWHLVDQYIK